MSSRRWDREKRDFKTLHEVTCSYIHTQEMRHNVHTNYLIILLTFHQVRRPLHNAPLRARRHGTFSSRTVVPAQRTCCVWSRVAKVFNLSTVPAQPCKECYMYSSLVVAISGISGTKLTREGEGGGVRREGIEMGDTVYGIRCCCACLC